VRFVFAPPADTAAGLLTLPWRRPLEEWDDERLLEIPQRGISRHVVRFVAEGGDVYALKEIPERFARREYRLLRHLQDLGIPAVEVLGVVVERPGDLDSILVTRFLDYSSSFRALLANPRGEQLTERLLDAQVELLARLHLAGFLWGDCSLSNTLFRFDAGALSAYLVDAETAETHPRLSDGQRRYELDVAHERVAAELLDLQAGGLLSDEIDAVEVADQLVSRYDALWDELTSEEVMQPQEQRYRIAERIRRLNDLGFDVDEVELIEDAGGGSRLRLTTRVAEPGHHRRTLLGLTGLDVQENQARRLLNDIDAYRTDTSTAQDEELAAHEWVTHVFEPIVKSIPRELSGKLEPAEVVHQVLEHRWYISEAQHRNVPLAEALQAYLDDVLRHRRDEAAIILDPGAGGPGLADYDDAE
jgi:hypothetical protein